MKQNSQNTGTSFKLHSMSLILFIVYAKIIFTLSNFYIF